MKNRNIERVGKKEEEYIKEVLDTQFRSSKGAMMMTRFEEAFKKKYNSKFAISHINGTATLHSCLAAAGVGPGDEVIVPPLTMSSTSFAVMQQNAVPVFADVDPETFEIDVKYIEPLINERTKAIITVALYGLSPDMDPIMDLAKKHNLMVIEDNAQAFLSYYKGKLAGTIGHMSSFSFQSSKHITAGEGGIILTDDENLALAIRRFSSLGYAGVGAGKGKITKKDIQNPNYERHIQMGFNYRMPELCAGVALAQTERIEELVKRRIEVAKLFDSVIKEKNCSWLVPQKIPDYAKSSYWTYVVKLEHPKIKWKEFQNKFLELGGDGFYAAWKLTYQEPMFESMSFNFVEKIYNSGLYKGKLQDFSKSICPNAEELQKKLIQFKTNYWNWEDAEKNAEVLRRIIDFFDKK
jgi:perosamine synthetase